jgi:DNA polymerase III gamma/tau subunit
MRLSSIYQPTTLDEVVGQPAAIRRLKRIAANPFACCLLMEGGGGVGKSAAAKALIHDLGVSEFGIHEYSAA